MYGIPAKQLMKMYKQSSIFVAAVLTIVRNSSGPLLWKISWDTKYLDCNKRINHLHKKRAFTVITTIGDKIGQLHDDVILLPRPQSFSFFLSYLNLVTPARFKGQKP